MLLLFLVFRPPFFGQLPLKAACVYLKLIRGNLSAFGTDCCITKDGVINVYFKGDVVFFLNYLSSTYMHFLKTASVLQFGQYHIGKSSKTAIEDLF